MYRFAAGMTFTFVLTYHMGRLPFFTGVSSAQPLDSMMSGEHACSEATGILSSTCAAHMPEVQED